MSNSTKDMALLSSEKRKLFTMLLEEEGVTVSQEQTIPRRRESNFVPLSFAQQRLWFLDQLEPGISVYNLSLALRVSGRLKVESLQQTLDAIVARHESLRTTFAMVDGEPVQVIAQSSSVVLPLVDLSQMPDDEHEAEAQRLAIKEAQQPFDLAQGPLFRASLLRLEDEEHVLLLTMHHIVSDGWSAAVLFRELTILYEAFSMGKPSQLPELAIQYADFAQWQRRWLQGKVLDKQLGYWRKQLAGAPPMLELPTDRPRPAVQSFRGGTQSLLLPRELSEDLKALSQRERATLFMTLLAAFQTLLARYTNQDDIIVGSPIANRNRTEVEGLIGFFANTLVLRTDMSGDPTFRELLSRVREVGLSAYANQDVPFEKLVEELRPERSLSHTPLFQVTMVLQNTPGDPLHLSGLTLSPLAVDSATSKFDLTLDMAEGTEGLSCLFAYNTDLFEPATITRMMGHFQTLLEGIVTNPDEHLSRVPLLTPAEHHQLLVQWNDTTVDHPRDLCVHQLFEEQVERTPEAVAVVFEGEQLTYGELNARANQLAHYLRKLGVGPEVMVGICVERSVEMVVGLLGILKAGGAYVPLDPAYPQERLGFMLEDSQSPVLLTQRLLVQELPESRAEVVCLDADWEKIAGESNGNTPSEATARNLAYVIYTSGSTGKPKGVAIEHHSTVALLKWATEVFTSDELAGVLASTSICFDLSVFELFVTLSCGGTVILAENALQLPALATSANVTLINTVPSAIAELIRVNGIPPTVRTVNLAGEPLQTSLVQQIYQQGSVQQVFDLYGPSEDTTYSTFALRSGSGPATIGRPIANTQIYILDQHLQPLAIGVPGELYIGGEGLARGYLNLPELTAEKFIPNPFSREAGARLYKTGDLARFLPEGNIEFLGRVDHQVKIRGFRIELGEVEAVLEQHPAVLETVVVAREDEPGDKRLVAYLVIAQEPAPTVSELRSFLMEKLPDFMVPAAFMVLHAMPLTPNGKLDRRALPAPYHLRPELEKAFVAPRTPVEEGLSEIWAEILKLDKVGIHDNFFELGGDSILSIQIIARANQRGLRFTPKQLFQYQTIAELAAVADVTRTANVDQGLVVGSVPLTAIQHWFFEQNLPDPHHFNQAFMLEVGNGLDLGALEKIVQQLVLHHDALRLRFIPQKTGWQQINEGPELTPFSRIDLSMLHGAEQGSALLSSATELQASLNISKGPLLRVAFFDLGAQKPGRLLIVIHHLAVDGVSWRILLEDLQTAYHQLSLGKSVQLPPKTTSFQDWARRLTAHAQSKSLKQELAYWLAERKTQISRLPIDYSQGNNTEASARIVETSLNVEETRVLLQEVPKAYHTQINDLLLTSLAESFSRWTGVRRLLVDLEGHGREEIIENVDLSRTVGWFTTIFPILLDLNKVTDPGNALKSVKEKLRGIPNKGIGYGLLRYLSEDLTIADELRKLPQAEVRFNYLGQFDQVLPESSRFKITREFGGPDHSPSGARRYLLDIVASVTEGQLHLRWEYSESTHRPATVENLARWFIEALQSLINHCQSPEAGSYTPSDFPLAQIAQQQLDWLKSADLRVQDIYPLSHMQQGILFHTLYAPASREYFNQVIYRLQGSLNVAAFERAWQWTVDQHPILRTAFIWEQLDEPLQIVQQQVVLPWEHQDWRGLSPIEQQDRLGGFLQADRERGFELSNAPLMRMALVRLSDDTYQVIWSSHHLLLDGWSTSILSKEVQTSYEAFNRGQDSRLEPRRPFRDYIAWLQQLDMSDAEAFWRKTLKGFATPTPLGMDRVSSSLLNEEESYGEQRIQLSAAATASLQTFARQHKLTMNTLVQGAWALLLSGYSGVRDVIFGATLSGRPASLAGAESMVGLFINTLPMRVQVSAEASLLPWLKKLQEQQVEIRQYESSPLARVNTWSEVPRGVPLFQSIVVFENFPVDNSPERTKTLEIDFVSSVIRNSYPLTVRAIPKERLMLDILYDRRRFDIGTIERVLADFETLLLNIAAQPTAKLSEIQEILGKKKNQQRIINEKELEEVNLRKLKNVRRKALSGPQLGSSDRL